MTFWDWVIFAGVVAVVSYGWGRLIEWLADNDGGHS